MDKTGDFDLTVRFVNFRNPLKHIFLIWAQLFGNGIDEALWTGQCPPLKSLLYTALHKKSQLFMSILHVMMDPGSA